MVLSFLFKQDSVFKDFTVVFMSSQFSSICDFKPGNTKVRVHLHFKGNAQKKYHFLKMSYQNRDKKGSGKTHLHTCLLFILLSLG